MRFWCGVLLAAMIACSSQSPASNAPRPVSTPSGALAATTPTPAPAQRREPDLPDAREETAAAAAGGHLFLVGGYDGGGRDASSVFAYSPATRVWTDGPRFPAAVDHPSAATLDGRLYVSGGYERGRPTAAVYTLTGERWQPVASMSHARAAHTLLPMSGRLYALGGMGTGGEVGPAEVYDPGSDRWRDLAPIPLPRDHVAGFVLGAAVCAAGGRSPNTARVDCLDPSTGAWSRLPDLPIATSGAGAAAVGDQVVVAGGELASEGGTIIEQLARYRNGSWHRETMLEPRHGFQLAVLDGQAWACGGGNAPGLHPVAICTSIG